MLSSGVATGLTAVSTDVMSRVCKFGGSSLADAAQLRKVVAIVNAEPSRRWVVPSAPGKRFKGDTKV